MIRPVDPNRGYAAVYREQGSGWSGPTGFYDRDARAALPAGQAFTWSDIYVWAPQAYLNGQTEMEIAFEGQAIGGGAFALRLESVPMGVTGAPAVGAEWVLPKDKSFALTLPAYRTEDGKTGYRFSLTMTAGSSPPPRGCGAAMPPVVLLLGTGLWLLTRPRPVG